ncbi:DUF1302 domain-containing protein [Pseudomonas sp. PDM22]|uniref:DUF1302 domain-containing protein n=1 Tax=Pseudomonas sp. PDM22 TaxID=2769287 RepID=UPI00178255A5|nr:DUF1302 domain-containing protein [Pseudomonas sp. PDM22]MBD9516151.1 DUF1302 domain-containing protein [Pseudomonas sp. PDM22]
MTTRTTKSSPFQPRLLAIAVTMTCGSQAGAVDFNMGEIEGKFDSSITFGSSWSTTAPDKQFISNNNSMGVRGGKSSSRTTDDNRLNFKSGENISTIVKGLHDLELKYGESGAFLRGKYWYDFELKDGHQHFYDIDDHGRDQAAKSSGAMFLDAFVYHNYNLGDLPGNVRLGKQVVNWGESTFIQNGISSINPLDVAALRRPGSEVKEGLVPVQMFYVSQGLTENITAEAFYQFKWDKTVTDNCGTFFGADGVAKGCDDRLVTGGYDLAPGIAHNTSTNPQDIAKMRDDAYIPRGKDNDPRNSGQYGLALRWFVPELNETEFGAYAMKYHSRSPFLSTVRTDPKAANSLAPIRDAKYFIDYPEDIRLYGLSFATNLAGVSWGGEMSYRPNMPLQLNTADLVSATLTPVGKTSASPLFTTGFSSNTPAGGTINGYDRKPVLQVQTTVTKLFNQVMGADRLTVVGEVGYNRINGLGDTDGTDLRFGRSPAFGSGILPDVYGGDGAATCHGSNAGKPNASNPAQQCNSHGFYTADSWGYRIRSQLDYPNAVAGINLSPNLAWSHDVEGTGPNFEEGAKAVSLGLNADYQNTYTAALNYTTYFDGKYNTMTDRDFVSLSLGVNF